MSPVEPLLSIVVPVRNAAATLGDTLAALVASDLPRASYEIIVVDDTSDDGSPLVAARRADTVVRLTGGCAGPAYARNRGAELARADVIAFVDADVRVRPETLSSLLATLRARPELGAISASWDAHPTATNLCSQYWNLLLHYGNRRSNSAGAHFNAACGLVRRSTLKAAGMFDEWRFSVRGLEGVELGMRICATGCDVQLSSDIRVTHLKTWHVAAIVSEVWQRGMLLARSLGYRRTLAQAPSEVVFTLSGPVRHAAFAIGVLLLSAAITPHARLAILWATGVIFVLLANVRLHNFYFHERGALFALAVAPLHLLNEAVAAVALCVGWLLRDAVGDPLPDATTQAYSEVGLETWPPVRRRF